MDGQELFCSDEACTFGIFVVIFGTFHTLLKAMESSDLK
jgi:hypothetical protein